jgi:hypothetical protein
MGQQQLLLILLGVVVVGIAVVVGITMFQDNAISANRDAVTNDLVALGARAQQYYRRPIPMGGGGVSFEGLTMGKLVGPVTGDQWVNPNGTYSIIGSPTKQEVDMKGIGFEKTDGQFVEVHCRVIAESLQTAVIN